MDYLFDCLNFKPPLSKAIPEPVPVHSPACVTLGAHYGIRDSTEVTEDNCCEQLAEDICLILGPHV